MSKNGTYEERLPCGGTLQVSVTNWSIRYYFPGLTARHNGTFFTIEGKQVPDYIQELRESWKEFEKLKASIPPGGDFSKTGKLSTSIRISAFAPGVCLHYHHLPMNSEKRLNEVLDGFEYAIRRAPQVQALLATL